VKKTDPLQPLTVIEPRKDWQAFNWRELKDYRDLLYFWVLREIKILYRQTVLGFTWALIRPVASMIVFSVVFGKLARVPSDGIPYPIFAYAALMPWTYFSQSLIKSTDSLVQQASVISKIYFPRLIIPMAPVLAGLLDFVLSFLVFFILMFVYHIQPTWNILYIPLLVVIMVLTASGLGMWTSALGIQYRDVRQAMMFIVQLLMYASPIVWPISIIPFKYRTIYAIYPMAGVIEGFRAALIGKHPMPWYSISIGSISAICLFITGAIIFNRMEKNFADVA